MSKRSRKQAAAPTEGHGSHYVEHLAWRLAPPWIVLVLLAVAGVVLHVVLSASMIRLAWGVFGLTVATTVLVVLAVVAGSARAPVVRTWAAATVITAGLWLIVTSIVGAGSVGYVLAALLVGVVVALSWNFRTLLRGRGDDDGHQDAKDWQALGDDIKVLRGRIRQQRTEGATRRAQLQLPPGMTAQDAQQDVPKLASALGVPATGVRITPDPDDASRVELSVTPEDMLRHTIHWPGPSAPGRSVAEPLLLGRYEDGQDLALRLPGIAGRQAMSHILIVGMTGAGKSELLQVLIADAGTRADVVIDYLDVAGKAEQTVGPIRSAIRTLVTDKRDAKAYLRRKLAEVPDRARALAAAGMREWQPGAPVPFEVLVVDEGASLVADSTDFVEMARVLRSVGVLIVLAIQRATYDQMPTSARANFGTVACFGVRTERDADTALSPETVEAGAQPHVWRNRKPGYLYLEAPGVPEERFSMPARAFLAAADDVERILREAAPLRHAAAAAPAAVVLAMPTPEETRAAASRALAEAGEEGEFVDEPDDEPTPGYVPPEHLAAELAAVDPDAELADIPGADMDGRIGPPERVPPLTPEQAAGALREFLGEFRRVDPGQFRRRDLIAAGALQVTGRSRSWLSGQLAQMVDEGSLSVVGEREDGVYAWASERVAA